MKNKGHLIPYITAIITNFIFGFSFLFSKNALSISDPISLLAFRFLAAFLVMTVLIMLKVIKVNYKNKPLKWLIILATIEPIIYFIFETFGLKKTSTSLGGLMIALIPIIVTILAVFLLNEKPSLKQSVSIVLSVSGVMLIILMENSNDTGGSMLGVFLLSGAVLSAAFFNIIARKISNDFTPIEVTYFMMFLGAICFNGISIFNHIMDKNISTYFKPLENTTFIISVLYLGIISSVLAYFLANYTLAKLEASRSAIFANISTIVSIIAGVVFLHESFHMYHIIGSIMILIGVWGTNYFKGVKDYSKGNYATIVEENNTI
ncbi:DMT family transporter [Clostridium sp. HBUAS56017]|uniref:DMT family transporter n=1 Tax=Clostridium sp. HBUAS56017 TaxID=2571128 RepID=UPI00117783FC|nr:DMT family transporter [Clostridium sp. HBUAS56017]